MVTSYTVCSARNVIECAFERLKERFAVLKRVMDINIDGLPYVIQTCFMLHNFCELTVSDEEVRRTVDYDREFQLQTLTNRHTTDCNKAECKRNQHICTKYFDT